MRSGRRTDEGRRVLRLGQASRKHGLAVCIHRAGQVAGETLAILEKHGVQAEAIRSDARISAEVNALFEGVVARHGRPDIVVHTPGAIIKKPLVEFTDEDFDSFYRGAETPESIEAATHHSPRGRLGHPRTSRRSLAGSSARKPRGCPGRPSGPTVRSSNRVDLPRVSRRAAGI
jgi:Enoyl-(Acyl carrier protein) reductase